MTETVDLPALISRMSALPNRRHLVGIAGPPAAGKSTLVEALLDALNDERPGRAAILAMDGYHFDDRVLEARGHRPRKGAPHTFDVGGLKAMLRRLRRNDEDEIAAPLFDRSIEIARAGAAIIPKSVEIVLVEGNWLLLDLAPWRDLVFDLTVLIDVPEDVLRGRLLARWQALEGEALWRKIEENDLPNARLVRERSRSADLLLRA